MKARITEVALCLHWLCLHCSHLLPNLKQLTYQTAEASRKGSKRYQARQPLGHVLLNLSCSDLRSGDGTRCKIESFYLCIRGHDYRCVFLKLWIRNNSISQSWITSTTFRILRLIPTYLFLCYFLGFGDSSSWHCSLNNFHLSRGF